jgi:hypothetical protein
MEVAKALRCLGEGLRCFDFVQLIDICSKSENVGVENAVKFAWNSVCLLFSRGLFISARLPFVPPDTLLQLRTTSILDSANQLYKSPPELEIKDEGDALS